MVKISKFSRGASPPAPLPGLRPWTHLCGRCPLTPTAPEPHPLKPGVCYRLLYLLRLVTLCP